MSDAAIIALVGAIFGGAGLKVIEKLLNRGQEKFNFETQLRKELRDDVLALRSQVERLEGEVDSWRLNFFALLDVFASLKWKLIELGFDEHVIDIDGEIAKIRSSMENFKE